MKAQLFIASVLLSAHAANAEVVERSSPADPRGELQISNIAGEVRIEGWDKSEVQVQAELGSDVQELEFKRKGALTRIEVIVPQGRGYRRIASELLIRVPRDSSLDITTVSAAQDVKGVRGSQRLNAVSGSIQSELAGNDIEAQTVSGQIEIKGATGAARVTSVSGAVTLDKIGPQLDLTTVTGSMRVEMDRLQRARIKTTNGSLELRTQLAPNARLEAEAINGSVHLQLQGELNAQFAVATFNGTIDNCFGSEPRRTREHGPGREWRHTAGSGSADVRIKTLNGRVEICNK